VHLVWGWVLLLSDVLWRQSPFQGSRALAIRHGAFLWGSHSLLPLANKNPRDISSNPILGAHSSRAIDSPVANREDGTTVVSLIHETKGMAE